MNLNLFKDVFEYKILNGVNIYNLMIFTIDKYTSLEINKYIDERYNKNSKVIFKNDYKNIKLNSKIVQTADNERLGIKKGYVGKVVSVDNLNGVNFVNIEFKNTSKKYYMEELKDVDLGYSIPVYEGRNIKFTDSIFVINGVENNLENVNTFKSTMGLTDRDEVVFLKDELSSDKITEHESILYEEFTYFLNK